ncbi:MAG: single-stranded DNA-binding protein [Planctomycetes bacterium]|jgi:single-strand DNA-binding protein|nr:single-stranded DNA-binding protein [Planctomycetota bacterium]MDA8378261.1 single-stranded DNA-binding protein [Planctomycetia bacterium]
MANLNKVFLMGNLTREPKLSYTPNQTPVCDLGLAVNRRWTGQDGQPHEEVTYVDCSAFARTAETLAKYLHKGRPVFIEGRLKLDQWEAQDGAKRSKMRVIIENFQFIDSRPAGSGAEATSPDEGGDPSDKPANRAAIRPTPAARPAATDVPPHPAAESEEPPIRDDDIPF